MQPEDYQYLYDLEENFWWFVGMRVITAALLDPVCPTGRARLVLDAGCGTGFNLKWLERYAGGGTVFGIDLAAEALNFCRSRGHTNLARASVTALPFPDALFDLVTSFDVLGQLPGTAAAEGAVHEMYRILRPGGIALVRAAAYETLRSGHDAALGTHRRYNRKTLTRLLERAGFRIVRSTYANSLLLPLAAFRRLILKPLGLIDPGSDVKALAPGLKWLNAPLCTVLLGEAHWLGSHHLHLPAGLSVICVVEKPNAAL